MRCLALLSGGKDSWYALYLAILSGFEIVRAVTFLPARKDSYMLHHPAAGLVRYQCRAASVPHEEFRISGEKEKEVDEKGILLREITRLQSELDEQRKTAEKINGELRHGG